MNKSQERFVDSKERPKSLYISTAVCYLKSIPRESESEKKPGTSGNKKRGIPRAISKLVQNQPKSQILIHKKDPTAGLLERLYTPPVAEILCVKNGRAIVVCGFLMK